jgi:DNA-binding transcriptional LysR family regulator
MSSSDQLIDLLHDRLDLGFVHTTRVPPGFGQILVSSQPFVACLPAAHPLARKRRLSLKALSGEPFAMVARAVSPDYHDRILGLCAQAGFAPEPRFELRHWLSVVSVVAQGLCVSLVPAALQAAGVPGAVFVPLDVDTPPYETQCLWRIARSESAQQTPALGAFLQVVRAAAQPA